MATIGRHAASCCCDGDAVVTQDLASFIDQLFLFGGVTVFTEVAGMGQHVAVDGVGIGRLGNGFAMFFTVELTQTFHAATAHALVGGNNQSFDAVGLVDWG